MPVALIFGGIVGIGSLLYDDIFLKEERVKKAQVKKHVRENAINESLRKITDNKDAANFQVQSMRLKNEQLIEDLNFKIEQNDFQAMKQLRQISKDETVLENYIQGNNEQLAIRTRDFYSNVAFLRSSYFNNVSKLAQDKIDNNTFLMSAADHYDSAVKDTRRVAGTAIATVTSQFQKEEVGERGSQALYNSISESLQLYGRLQEGLGQLQSASNKARQQFNEQLSKFGSVKAGLGRQSDRLQFTFERQLDEVRNNQASLISSINSKVKDASIKLQFLELNSEAVRFNLSQVNDNVRDRIKFASQELNLQVGEVFRRAGIRERDIVAGVQSFLQQSQLKTIAQVEQSYNQLKSNLFSTGADFYAGIYQNPRRSPDYFTAGDGSVFYKGVEIADERSFS